VEFIHLFSADVNLYFYWKLCFGDNTKRRAGGLEGHVSNSKTWIGQRAAY